MRSGRQTTARICLLLTVIVCMVFSFTGCSGNAGKSRQIKVLSMGTHGVGSLVNAMGTGLATVLSEGLGIEVRVVASSGPTEWLPMVASEEMDLGVLNAWDAQMGNEGKSVYGRLSNGKGFPILLITSGHKALNGVVVPESSGIRAPQDLKGRRYVGLFTGSPGITAQAEAALANFGLKETDVNLIPVPSIDAGVRNLVEGRAEASIANVGMGIVSELEASRGARFLSFDPSPRAVQKMQAKFPSTLFKVSPGSGKTGVQADTFLMSYDFYLVGRANLPEELVYLIVRTLWEKNEELTRINTQLQDWTPSNFVTNFNTIAYHPGAVRLYREKNVWSSEMQQRQQELEKR
ncbi:MAG: TAXI family TRAP transporter solute-binding subunit [Acidobacteria bacterium]|nr:TAXI family TRAP transporter solute-binding subunit [Acidobacteriota bacterium]